MHQTNFIVETKTRLDNFLAEQLHETRNQVAQLIKKEAVTVDDKIVSKPGLKLKGGETICVTFPETETTQGYAVDFDVEILYEDEHILVLNKPSNLTVHPAPSVQEATLVDWLKKYGIQLSTISGEERHGIVHRLDKGTSGAMVIAKTNEAHEKLSLQLQDKSMGRYYLALLDAPLKANAIVEKPIYRNQNNRLKMSVSTHAKAKAAKTAFAKVAQSTNELYNLIACKLFTGRTHQIRVHLESISRHICGDHLYGLKSKKDIIERIFLHAYVLYLIHPVTQERMTFMAPLPVELTDVLDSYFDKEVYEKIGATDTITNYFNDMDNWLYYGESTEQPFA